MEPEKEEDSFSVVLHNPQQGTAGCTRMILLAKKVPGVDRSAVETDFKVQMRAS